MIVDDKEFIEVYNNVEKYQTLQKVADKLEIHKRTVGKIAKRLREDGVELNNRSTTSKLDITSQIFQRLPGYRTPTKRDETNSCILVISDMHIPYHHEDIIPFFKAIKEKYNPDRIIGIGDECFPPDAEILTEGGWETFESYTGGNVAQWNERGEIEFVVPDRYFKKHISESLFEIKHQSYYSLTTQRHKIVKIRPSDGKVFRREAIDTDGSLSWHIPRTGIHSGEGIALSDNEIALQVAFQADGTFAEGAVRFEFLKTRKIDRLQNILTLSSIPYNIRKTKRDTTVIYIEKANTPIFLSKTFDRMWCQEMTLSQKKHFLEEIKHWDSTLTNSGFRYVSMVSENLDIVQSIAVTAGMQSKKVDNRLDVIVDRYEKTSQKSATFNFIDYEGDVYCVTVPTGMIVVRQNGMVNITGNCDNHAMSFHDSDPDVFSAGHELKRARETIKEIEKIFPQMDLVDSNHGSLYYRKAKAHGIPKEAMVSYNDLLGVGDGWKWHFDLTLTMSDGNKVYFHHGKTSDALTLSQRQGMCAVQGHYHGRFKADYWSNTNGLYWGLQVGCLINDNSLAFSYNKNTTDRPIIGCGIIINGQPKLLPMIKKKDGRWNGKLD